MIEDDYDSEFRYEGRPTDALQSLDSQGVLAYIGTFSKVLLPELRLGYLIPPPGLFPALVRVRQISDWHSSTLPQWALSKFIAEGYLLKHIRRCHGIYAGRRERILARLDGDLAPWLKTVPSVAGFHLTVRRSRYRSWPNSRARSTSASTGSPPSMTTSRRAKG